MTLAGDSVRTVANQRLDKPDADQIQALVYEYTMRVLGGVVGPCQGALTQPFFDATNNAAVEISECLLAYVEETGLNALSTGIVLRYDPALSWQSGFKTIDLSGHEAGAEEPWIWARREAVDSEQDTRRKWDTVGGAEVAFPTMTTSRERVRWGVSPVGSPTAVPDASTGWFKVARVTAWSGALPTIVIKHAWDAAPEVIDQVWRKAARLWDVSGIGVSNKRYVGLARLVAELLSRVAYMVDEDWFTNGTNWTDSVTRGLKTLHTDLAAAEASLTTALANISNLQAQNSSARQTLAMGAIEWDGVNWSVGGSSSGIVSATAVALGQVRVKISVATAWQSVCAVPKPRADLGADILPGSIYCKQFTASEIDVYYHQGAAAATPGNQSFYITVFGA